MMDYLINHFQSFAENYSLVMIELYLFLDNYFGSLEGE